MLKIIINGGPGVGKDTVTDFVKKYTTFPVFNISTVDKVKEAHILLGWDGIKTSESRKALSDTKDMSTNLYDGPQRYIKESLSKIPDEAIVFIHSREPSEIAKFRIMFDTHTLLVRRETGETVSNHADANVEKFEYDYIIENDGTLDDLFVKTGKFFQKLGEDLDRKNETYKESNRKS